MTCAPPSQQAFAYLNQADKMIREIRWCSARQEQIPADTGPQDLELSNTAVDNCKDGVFMDLFLIMSYMLITRYFYSEWNVLLEQNEGGPEVHSCLVTNN